MMATLLFFLITLALVAAWNRLFRPVPWRIALAMWAAVAIWQAETLFTSKVDVPGNLAFQAYPWKALNRPYVPANTGIALQEMIPWTEAARRALKNGELPLWDRGRGGGTPLLSDQQHGIFHPFNLIGLLLPIGKAWTLSVALRLFFALFFLFVLLKNWDLRDGPALFGAIAYAFSTFHIVWLTISVSLTLMMLPMTLAAADELLRRPRIRSFALVVISLMMAVFGGHPESVFFVALTTGAYSIYAASGVRRLALAAGAAIAAMLLTAFFWYPTLATLKQSDRWRLMQLVRENPPEHHIDERWLMPVIVPNILGTPQTGTYRAPEPHAPDLLNDYGEIACAYAGLVTLALAFAAIPLVRRRPPAAFALGLMIWSALVMIEPPGWLWLMRRIPLLDVSLLQRWRFAWSLGAVILAAIALDAEVSRRRLLISSAIVLALFGVIVFAGPHRDWTIFAPLVLLVLSVAPPTRPRAAIATIAVFLDLFITTLRFNPPALPNDVLPTTGAIEAMRNDKDPHRIVAIGWSFLPDTPGYYGLEDVKTTDPLARPEYLRFFNGYFATKGDFDQTVRATHYPFIDFLNVRYLYVPPGESPLREDVRPVYQGADGTVYRNDRALPRYFVPARIEIEPDFSYVVAKARNVTDFRAHAFVDHIPEKVRGLAGEIPLSVEPAPVRVIRYASNEAELEVDARAWSLVASSDTWWPGWRAYVNGRRMPPVKVNGAFVGVFVPPGRSRVVLRYRPREFDDGLRAGAIALVVLIGMAIAWRKRW